MPPPVPIALPIAGQAAGDYAAFTGGVAASWAPDTGLVVHLADADPVPLLTAPLRGILRYVARGQPLAEGGAPLAEDTLELRTWPTDYLRLAEPLGGRVPARIVFGSIDPPATRAVVPDLVAATPVDIAPTELAAIEADFMSGSKNLLALSGATIGRAATESGAAPLPRRVTIRMFDGADAELHPVYFLGRFAELTGVDAAAHPLLSELDLAAATEPSLSAQLIRVEDPDAPGSFRPAEFGLFATLAPRLRITVADAAAAAAMRVTLRPWSGEAVDVSARFVYDAAEGAAFATLSGEVAHPWIYTLEVTGPFDATASFVAYSAARSEFAAPVEDEAVATGDPLVVRSDKLLAIVFAAGATDAEMGEVLRTVGLLPVALHRPAGMVTALAAPGQDAVALLPLVRAATGVESAFVPGVEKAVGGAPKRFTDTAFIGGGPPA